MRHFAKPALAILVLIASTAAHADTIINFGSSTATDVTFAGYTQGIYVVTPILTAPNGGWVLNGAQGNPPPGISGGNVISPEPTQYH